MSFVLFTRLKPKEYFEALGRWGPCAGVYEDGPGLSSRSVGAIYRGLGGSGDTYARVGADFGYEDAFAFFVVGEAGVIEEGCFVVVVLGLHLRQFSTTPKRVFTRLKMISRDHFTYLFVFYLVLKFVDRAWRVFSEILEFGEVALVDFGHASSRSLLERPFRRRLLIR